MNANTQSAIMIFITIGLPLLFGVYITWKEGNETERKADNIIAGILVTIILVTSLFIIWSV